MREIWKYELETTDFQKIKMPIAAQILTAQVQGKTLCLWVLVNPEAEKEIRVIQIIGTGHPINIGVIEPSLIYISTYQLQGGKFISHVFEYVGL